MVKRVMFTVDVEFWENVKEAARKVAFENKKDFTAQKLMLSLVADYMDKREKETTFQK